MREQLLLHLNGRWYRVTGGALTAIDTFPRLDAPATLITDFGGALTDVIVMEGRTSYAPMIIEKHVREQGLIDGQGRVMVHRLLRNAGGFRALFTVVPIKVWQQLMEWANRQPVDCMVVSLHSVLCRLAASRKSRALVFRHENQLIFLQVARGEFRYEQAYAYDRQRLEWQEMAGQFGRRVGSVLSSEDSRSLPAKVEWYVTWPEPSLDDAELVEAFAAAADVQSSIDGSRLLRDDERTSFLSVIPLLQRQISGFDALNGSLTRVTAVLEQLMPVAAVAMLTIAVILGVVAWKADQKNQQAAASLNQAQSHLQMQQRQLAELKTKAALPARFKPVEGFVSGMLQARRQPNPVTVLAAVRKAAAQRVRVLRVSLAAMPGHDAGIRVEGVVPGGGVDTDQLANFVDALRRQGFKAYPVNSVDTRSMPGVFAYALARTGGKN